MAGNPPFMFLRELVNACDEFCGKKHDFRGLLSKTVALLWEVVEKLDISNVSRFSDFAMQVSNFDLLSYVVLHEYDYQVLRKKDEREARAVRKYEERMAAAYPPIALAAESPFKDLDDDEQRDVDCNFWGIVDDSTEGPPDDPDWTVVDRPVIANRRLGEITYQKAIGRTEELA